MAPDNPEEASEKVIDAKVGENENTDQDVGGTTVKEVSKSGTEPNDAVVISDSENGDEETLASKEKNDDDDDDVITITANDGSLGRGHLIAPRPQVPEDNDVELLDDDDEVQEIANQDEDDLLAEDVDEEESSRDNKIIYNELDSSMSNDTGKLADGTGDDEDDVLLLSDEDESSMGDKSSMGNSGLSRNQQAMFAKSGLIIESVRSGAENSREIVDDDDDVMEIEDHEDMYEESENDISQDDEVQLLRRDNGVGLVNGGDSNDSNNSDVKEIDETSTIVVNDTKSLAELANSKQDASGNAGKEPTLVIIDTNSILTGKGPLPISNKHNNNNNRGQVDANSLIRASSALKGSASASATSANNSIDIPDDAFLIEAPSFIVPYVFEQSGDKSMKEKIKEVHEMAKADKEEKISKGEALGPEDQIYEPKKPSSDDYFESPVGKLLMNIGVNLVQEFVQVDLLKFQKRQGEKEKKNSRMGMMTHMTQQSIISLKKNIDETKENNEPFKSKMKKCELCNFKTESELVMSTHLETPHMRNYSYRCNFCTYTTRVPQEIIFHMEAEHTVKARLERAPAYHQCPNCHFEDNSKAKLNRHLLGCTKRFNIEKNMEPPSDWDTPAKLPKLPKNRSLPHGINPAFLAPPSASGVRMNSYPGLQGRGSLPNVKGNLPPLLQAPKNKPIPGLIRTTNPRALPNQMMNPHLSRGMMMKQMPGQIQQAHLQLGSNQMLQQVVSGQLLGIGQGAATSFLNKLGLQPGQATGSNASLQKSASPQFARGNMNKSNQPSISITPLPRQQAANAAASQQKPSGKTSFVICEICDGYIKDLDQLRNHMQWIHKVKIHPKMIYNKPPLNCQKCQFRFFTDQGLERHLLGSHGLVTSSMQDAANKGQDSGRCPLCGKVYQWKLLAHVAKDHNVTLKPAHLSYKCTVCTATFGMYKLFESHVYSAHSVTKNATARNDVRRPTNQPSQGIPNRSQLQVTPRPMPTSTSSANFKPLKINDEITIIPQPMANAAQRSKGSLTITPQPAPRRNVRSNEDDGIQIIEIDDAAPKISSNGRSQNGDFKGRFPMSETLRKRNLEISLCGTDSDNSDDSRGPGPKRIRQN